MHYTLSVCLSVCLSIRLFLCVIDSTTSQKTVNRKCGLWVPNAVDTILMCRDNRYCNLTQQKSLTIINVLQSV